MPQNSEFDAWSAGDAYELYMGRWSRRIASRYLDWLAPKPDLQWLDVGCGTGALTATILDKCQPKSVHSLDPSQGFVVFARANTPDPRTNFQIGTATDLPFGTDSFDVVTSGLVLNFVEEPLVALAEFRRVIKPTGTLSFYVWDYPGGGMGMIDAFWAAAAAVDPKSAELNESARFPTCTRDGIVELCRSAGFDDAKVTDISDTTDFPDFEAFWQPFTLGAGPAPGYCKSLPVAQQVQLKDALASQVGNTKPVSLPARAWAAKIQIVG